VRHPRCVRLDHCHPAGLRVVPQLFPQDAPPLCPCSPPHRGDPRVRLAHAFGRLQVLLGDGQHEQRNGLSLTEKHGWHDGTSLRARQPPPHFAELWDQRTAPARLSVLIEDATRAEPHPSAADRDHFPVVLAPLQELNRSAFFLPLPEAPARIYEPRGTVKRRSDASKEHMPLMVRTDGAAPRVAPVLPPPAGAFAIPAPVVNGPVRPFPLGAPRRTAGANMARHHIEEPPHAVSPPLTSGLLLAAGPKRGGGVCCQHGKHRPQATRTPAPVSTEQATSLAAPAKRPGAPRDPPHRGRLPPPRGARTTAPRGGVDLS
jgi:hypothetical protein